jgi:hypothetical protein
VTVNSKEKNSSDFCPDYVQEFDLCSLFFFFAASSLSTLLFTFSLSFFYRECLLLHHRSEKLRALAVRKMFSYLHYLARPLSADEGQERTVWVGSVTVYA